MKQNLSTAMTALMLSLASLTLPPVSDLHAADIFTRITTGPGADAGNSRGAAWGDYDNDGFIDLFIPQIGSPSANHLLYHNNTDGTFSRVTTGPVAQVFSASRGGAWADYDNDGYLDLILVNENQPNYLFHNGGNGSFAAVSSSVSSDVANGRGVTWVDYDNDGYVDIFRAGEEAPRRLYRNNHDGSFTRITGPEFLTVPGGFLGVAWGDYNNDGRPDLFLPSVVEPPINYLYRNDGGGGFTRVGAGMMDGIGNQTGGGAWGDYDNDGDLDLFASCAVTHAQGSAPNLFYRNDGNGTFTRLTSLPANDPEFQGGASFGCTWGDYDNDGWLDLFVANQGFQSDFLYHNNANGTFTKILDSVVVNDRANGLATAWGDYDNDGFLDLFVGGQDSAPHLLYHNNGNDNHWIKFRLIGTASNRAAIGAKVRVRATIHGQSFWQMREVSGGDGVRGQNSLHVHVGLGNATSADLVRIEWPSGIVQEFRDIVANQMLAIQESNADILPAKADVSLGAALTLSLTHVPPESTLQWRLNSVDVAGATNATLEFSSATTNLNGQYTIVVSNATALIFPRPAVVRVFDRPIITSQPQSTNVPVGTIVTFSVTAFSPSPITYQWQFNGVDLPGQTSSTLTMTNVQLAHDGLYTVVATDATGSVTSQSATLTVPIKPVIVLASASNLTNVAGATITLGVAIEGRPPPFFYLWRSNSTVIRTNFGTSATSDFLTTPTRAIAGVSNTFRVEVTNLLGTTLTTFINRLFFTNHTVADSDGDGLPDGYEIAYAGVGGLLEPLGDEDGDRLNNLAEYRAGTNPTNAASVLKLDVIAVGAGATLRFEAVANRIYTLEHSPAPGLGLWTPLNRWVPLPTNQVRTVLEPEPAPHRVYRVRVD